MSTRYVYWVKPTKQNAESKAPFDHLKVCVVQCNWCKEIVNAWIVNAWNENNQWSLLCVKQWSDKNSEHHESLLWSNVSFRLGSRAGFVNVLLICFCLQAIKRLLCLGVLRVFVFFCVLAFVRAILSWCPYTWHIHIVNNILSLNSS